MRTTLLTVLVFGLMTAPALAITKGGGPNYKYGFLSVINQCDGAVVVTVDDGDPVTLEPGQATNASFRFKSSQISVPISAYLTATPSVSANDTCKVYGGSNTVATITSDGSTLTITCPKPSTAAITRESGVMLASAGGLIPLLWLAAFLGRPTRRRLLAGDDQLAAPLPSDRN